MGTGSKINLTPFLRPVLAAALLCVAAAAKAAAPDTVFLEELTWTEVRDALKAGKTTVILPTGGTEQNGPHMALGKHNVIVRHCSERIARRLGNALVAPVMAYVPEGRLDPPEGHTAFPGTITLPPEDFAKVVEAAARSFKASGFTDIVLIGDSGPNQAPLAAVAARLNREWARTPVRVHHIAEYYAAGSAENGAFMKWLRGQGETKADIGEHAGIADTSQLMAIAPGLVRGDKLAPGADWRKTGVSGNPARARPEYGRRGLDMKVEAAVARIAASVASPRERR
jgi:creatinine amidohydrolase/Fe(II)-dependent formamide hydrolase-like protein